MIIGVTDQRLINEGLQPGSTITHVNDDEVDNLEDYMRLARIPRFTIRVRSLEESNTFKIVHESQNPGIVVDTELMVSDVEDEKNSIHINHRVEQVNGVALDGDFKKFQDMTTDKGTYFITLSWEPVLIPTRAICDAILSYNQGLTAKITSEVEMRFDNLTRWQALLSNMRTSNMRTETHQEQVAPEPVLSNPVRGRMV